MPTKLGTFNECLRILGQPAMSSVDEAGEPGDTLRGTWDASTAACYEIGTWNFIILRAALTRLGTAPTWGYKYYYQLPADFQRVVEISQSGIVGDPIIYYQIENGRVATDAEAVYLTYVTNNSVAITPGNWSQAFADFVAADMAVRCASRINASAIELADGLLKSRRSQALSLDAIQSPPTPRRPGNWTRAARGMGRNQEQGPAW